MSKAEDLSKQYKDYREQCGIKDPVMLNEIEEAYFEGYYQAEKDLELTNEDVYDIWRIYNEVCEEGQIFGFDETGEEVLKRFKELKDES